MEGGALWVACLAGFVVGSHLAALCECVRVCACFGMFVVECAN